MNITVEKSLKRCLKRKITFTLGMMVAFLITGSLGYAEESYFAKDTDIVIEKEGDVNLTTDYIVENKDNRYSAIGADGGNLNFKGDKLNISNKITTGNMIFGVSNRENGTVNITANEINLNMSTTEGAQIRGIRNVGNNKEETKIVITGNITGNFTTDTGLNRAVDAWTGANTIINGNTDFTLTSTNGTISAVGAGEGADLQFNGESNKIVINSGTGRVVGIENWNNPHGTIEFNGDLDLTATTGENYNQWFQGVLAYQSTTNFNGNTNIVFENKSNISEPGNKGNNLIDIQCDPGNSDDTIVNFNGDTTNLTLVTTGESTNQAIGVVVSGVPGVANFNGKETNINIISENSNFNSGLWSKYGGTINSVEGNILNINVVSNKETIGDNESTYSYGILTQEYSGYNGNVTLNGKTNITVSSIAGNSIGIANTTAENVKDTEDGKVYLNGDTNIITTSQTGAAVGIASVGKYSDTKLSGNVSIKVAGNEDSLALDAQDGGLIDIIGENKTVQIDGDIKSTDATININLTGENSYINGNIFQESASTVATLDETNGTPAPNGINIILKDGATWNNKGNSSLGSLTMENGIINNTVDGSISIDSFSGSGGTINAEAKLNTDGTLSTGDITIKEVETGNRTNLDIVYKGVTADNLDSDDLDELVGHTKVESGTITGTGKIEEGLINGEIVGNVKIGQNGSLEIVSVSPQKPSTTVDGLTNIAAINFLTWRQEMGSLNERMGELRDTQGTSGVWARVYGGEFELDGNYKNKYQTYQVGYDKNYDYAGGKLFLGYLFSYTDGSTDYDLGSGENSSFGAGVYGTWLNNSGHYIDVIAKINRLHNEYDIYSKGGIQSKGDYTNYGISLSAEYGKRFTLDRVFIEPSVRMDLGKIGHESYTTSSGVRVDQDRMYTAQGSLGAKLGYKLDKGNIYARLSGVKEFAGDVDMKYQLGNTSNTHREDFEDEWIEFGVGGNYKVAENVNLYLDLSRTTDATVDTNWQANLGFRWEL